MLKRRLERANAPAEVMQVTHALLRRDPLHAGVDVRATAQELAQVPAHKRLANAPQGRGLPIGNLSSQFFANVYLDALDQFVKHTLKARRYLRYVDDFVIVHHHRTQLERWQAQIVDFLRDRLHLELKAETKLQRLHDGIDFLGYIVRPTHTLVRPRVVAHMREALTHWAASHVRGNTIRATPASLQRVQAIAASYAGHLRHANSTRLTAVLHVQFPWLAAACRPRNFHRLPSGRPIEIKFHG